MTAQNSTSHTEMLTFPSSSRSRNSLGWFMSPERVSQGSVNSQLDSSPHPLSTQKATWHHEETREA